MPYVTCVSVMAAVTGDPVLIKGAVFMLVLACIGIGLDVWAQVSPGPPT